MLAVRALASQPPIRKLQLCFRYQSSLPPGALIDPRLLKRLSPIPIQTPQCSTRFISQTAVLLKDGPSPSASSTPGNGKKPVKPEPPQASQTVEFNFGAQKKRNDWKKFAKEDHIRLAKRVLGQYVAGNASLDMLRRASLAVMEADQKIIDSNSEQYVESLSERGRHIRVKKRKAKAPPTSNGTSTHSIEEPLTLNARLEAFKESLTLERANLLERGKYFKSDAKAPDRQESSPPRVPPPAVKMAMIREEMKRHPQSDVEAYRGGFATADTRKFERRFSDAQAGYGKTDPVVSDYSYPTRKSAPGRIETTIAELRSNIADQVRDWELKKKDHLEELHRQDVELEEVIELKRAADKVALKNAKKARALMIDNKTNMGLWGRESRIVRSTWGGKQQRPNHLRELWNRNRNNKGNRYAVEKSKHAYGLRDNQMVKKGRVVHYGSQKKNEERDPGHVHSVEKIHSEGKEAESGASDVFFPFDKTFLQKSTSEDVWRERKKDKLRRRSQRRQPHIVADDWVTDQNSNSGTFEARNTPLDFLSVPKIPTLKSDAFGIPPSSHDSHQPNSSPAPAKTETDQPRNKVRVKGKWVKVKKSQYAAQPSDLDPDSSS